MKRFTLLKSMLLLCALVAGSGSVWAQGPDLTKFTWGTPIVDENFNGVATVSDNTQHNPAASVSSFGAINKIYNNDTGSNTYGIESTVFGSNAFFLNQATTKPLVAAIEGKTFGTTGAFTFKVKRTNNGMLGLYAAGANGTAYQKASSSVFFQIKSNELSINNGNGWVSVQTDLTGDAVEVFVIYNNTSSNASYGNSVSLAAKTAHVFVNGSCVMNGANPKAFTIPGAALTAFRVVTNANGATLNLDDLKIYSGLPTEPVTISAAKWATFSSTEEVAIPTGVTAYYAKEKSGSSITLKTIDDGIIPANEGVVLYSNVDAATTYYTAATSTSATAIAGNLLKPQTADGVLGSEYYILSVNGSGDPVFRKSSGSGTLTAGKAYLDLTSLAHEITIDFENGETTGISSVKSNAPAYNNYFNLNGQRVNANHKGLVIVNGKKYLNK